MTGASMIRVNSINNGRATKFCGLPYLGVFFDLELIFAVRIGV